MNKTNVAALIVSLAGAVKLALNAFGVDVPDAQFNEIVNGVSALATVIGPLVLHFRKPKSVAKPPQPTATPATTVTTK